MPLTITLDSHEFTLSDEALVAMATTFWRTRIKERGLMLCGDSEITAGSKHIGGPSSIHERNCSEWDEELEAWGERPRAGHFHTHPSPGTSSPSWWDAFNIVHNSYRYKKPWLACRGSKDDGLIRCETARYIPTLEELKALRRRRTRMRGTYAKDDPLIMSFLTESYTFEARRVPDIIKPPEPILVGPRIRTEQVDFVGSSFLKYISEETGEVIRVERVY